MNNLLFMNRDYLFLLVSPIPNEKYFFEEFKRFL